MNFDRVVQKMQVFTFLSLTMFAISMIGCGGGTNLPEGETGIVTGKVTSTAGDLPTGCSIVFINEGQAITATGVIGADGSYSLLMRGKPDILAGTYNVGVTAPSMELTEEQQNAITMGEAEAPVVDLSAIPEKYLIPESSGVTFDVKAGENTFDLELKAE
ncbi:MAG: carboxypeptidase-like regulatory domain-containing protein [Planctomycetaceae bacterium]|jgi:hypothetical protein|nr:carboxypeptidase-like regulatory domain-containing protein [bacterium]MDC0274294.1 carboxypeptidase-like regulatory domain-containing protein [Planctomycetaceae bacterium]MDG2390886.1 carboxypeptidase-like regulatory domain-containing protein [Planctomycetaceae bacterium]